MIIFLNGVSSSGKTSIVKALQNISNEIWMHVGIDTIIDMMHNKFWGNNDLAKDVFFFEQSINEEGKPLTAIKSGVIGKKIGETVSEIAKVLYSKNLNVIIDECTIHGNCSLYKKLFEDYDIYYVGIICDLDTIEKREKARGDRFLGQSRWMFDNVHKNMDYDLTVNTANMDSEKCAREILEFISNEKSQKK